jgi:DNA-binding transcriptional LysR family regulator
MKLQHLRLFVAVVECGGVVKAAERLHVSQPAVSEGLKALEEELGQPLFERASGRRLQPTPRSKDFYRHAVDILERCDAARAQFRDAKPMAAKLRLGILQTFAGREIIALSTGLARRIPELRLQLWEGGVIQLANWLRQGRIDMAWTIVESSGPHARRLWSERFVVFVSPRHRFAEKPRSRLSLADLEGESLILRTHCEMPRGTLWPERITMPIAARAARDELALQLVAEGIGITFAPESLAAHHVVARRVHDLTATRLVGLKWRADIPDELAGTVFAALSAVKRAERR